MEAGSRRLEATVSLIISGSYRKIHEIFHKKIIKLKSSFCYDLHNFPPPASNFQTIIQRATVVHRDSFY